MAGDDQERSLTSESTSIYETGDSTILNGSAITPSKAEAQKANSQARHWLNVILRFLSTANNETLCACAVGLGATLYLILGRIGLVLIGLIAGVVLHVIWEENEQENRDEQTKDADKRRRKEKSLDILRRVLDLKDGETPIKASEENDRLERDNLDFKGFAPDVKGALQEFTDAVIRDYVHWWYRPVLPDDASFPHACRQTLTAFFLAIANRLSRKRPGDMFLDFLTNSSSIVIVFLSELSSALSASRGLGPQEAVNEYLEENPGCSLGNVLNGEQQQRKLKAVAEDVLQTFVEAKAYACDPVRAFLREVLAGLILDMTINTCSKADFINDWIIWTLEESDTSELVEAIDKEVGVAASNEAVKKAASSTAHLDSARQSPEARSKADHRRTVSKAEAAMEEAMLEAQRLNEMIAKEEKARIRRQEKASIEETEQVSSSSGPEAKLKMNGAAHSAEVDVTHGSESAIDETSDDQRNQPLADTTASFKSFDQILAAQKPTALKSETSPPVSPPISPPLPQPQFTLHKAQVSIFDDSTPGEKNTIRAKPLAEYLIQIEPASSAFPGWMIARKYSDFETLHEVLRRISIVSGVTAFTDRHLALSGWKGNTKNGLRTELEKYLQDALSFQQLAECEGMKRFLDKDQHVARMSPNPKNTFPAAFETVGKGVLDVLTSAPKGAATGGKAIVGGVTGVFGTVGSLGQKRQSSKVKSKATSEASASNTSLPQSNGSLPSPIPRARESQEHVPSHIKSVPEMTEDIEPTPSGLPSEQIQDQVATHDPSNSSPERTAEASKGHQRSPTQSLDPETDDLRLPPPPSEISDDYRDSPRPSIDESMTLRSSMSTNPTTHSPSHKSTFSVAEQQTSAPSSLAQSKPNRAAPTPLSIQETTIAVELFFATINELYTLSSAWTLRLTLLNTAKSFLLRPGNANLEAIRQLLQSTIIDANSSDSGIAAHINKTRENALPTEEELKQWPPPLTPEESEQRRQKARKLLVEKGMPQALTSVMGQAASGEALGKVFDCLQVPEVARGLVFALVLQAVRALTQ